MSNNTKKARNKLTEPAELVTQWHRFGFYWLKKASDNEVDKMTLADFPPNIEFWKA